MNDDPNARPSLSERYSAAVSDGTGHERMILAAGMQPERLGVILLRLQSEYDAVRGELEHAGQIAPQRTAQARELMRRAELCDRSARDATGDKCEAFQKAGAILRAAAEKIRARTSNEVLSARAFILIGLKTLHDAKQRWGAFAVGLAVNNPKRGIKPATAATLAGQVLDVWLDPTCHTCDGTGSVGNAYAGEVRRQCGTCCGSAHRRDTMGRSLAETMFARDLLAELQRRAAAAAGGMGHALAPTEEPEPDAEALRQMRGRLADMRGAVAQTD